METELWLSELHGTDEERRERVLEETKNAVANSGRKLCLTLVEFLVDMSSDGDEEAAKLLRRVRSSLEFKIRFSKLRDDHNPAVLDKTFALLEAWERSLRDRDETRKLKNKGGFVAKPILRSIPTRKERFACRIIARLCEQIVSSEEIVCSALREEVSEETMNRNLARHEKEVGEIELDSVMGYIRFTMWEKSDGLNTLLDPMKNVVEQLWNEYEFY